jgi:copper chaperone CopZ
MFNPFQKKETNSNELVLKIEGMHCTSCALNIDGALEDLDGVRSATTSYAKSEVTVKFDEKKVTKEKIVQVVEREGYSIGS